MFCVALSFCDSKYLLWAGDIITYDTLKVLYKLQNPPHMIQAMQRSLKQYFNARTLIVWITHV